MQVKDIMTRDVEMINSDAKIIEAAQKMKLLEIGALPVWEGDELVGIITDRDITVRAIANGKDPAAAQVSEIMTPQIFYCYQDDDIRHAARMMEEKSVRRLLVLGSESEPVGFLSLADFSVKCRDEHLTGEVLEKVSEPACPHR
jgi:predicted transcriptional regulator